MEVPTLPAARSSKKRAAPARSSRNRSVGLSFADVCELAAVLPGVEQEVCYGTPALRVKGKFLLRLKEDGETVAIKIPMDDRDLLLKANPRVFYITDHYRGYPVILFRLSEISRNELASLLELGWCFVAPKRLLAAFETAWS